MEQRKNILKKFLTKRNKRRYPFPIPWKNPIPKPFSVYRIPTKVLLYNSNNTRIFSELAPEIQGKKPDLYNEHYQDIIQQILLTSKWIGPGETEKLKQDLLDRGMLDPAIATPNGILIDGNRRLAIFRDLIKKKIISDKIDFNFMDVCVLPDDYEEGHLKELELRLQMYHLFKVPYGDINTALEFRNMVNILKWSEEKISEITGRQYKPFKIKQMIAIIDLVDEYLEAIYPDKKSQKQYATLDKGWESFIALYNLLKWSERTDPDKIKYQNRKYFGFQIIRDPTTIYDTVRDFYRTLKQDESRKELESISDTLNGRNLDNLFSERRIDKELKNLSDALIIFDSENKNPTRIAEQAFKKLESIKKFTIKKDDRKFKTILERLQDKIKKLLDELE